MHAVDITAQVERAIPGSGLMEGIACVFAAGSTCALGVNEYEPGLMGTDIPEALERLFPKGIRYGHGERWHDGNGHSHVRSTSLGQSLTFPFGGAKPLLGTWWQVVFSNSARGPARARPSSRSAATDPVTFKWKGSVGARGKFIPDVQSRRLDDGFRLTKVGVTGVMKPVQVARPNKVATLTTTFDVFIDLPWDQRGAHLSRNLEAIGEIVDESVRNPVYSLEDLAAKISVKLLEKHSYATNGEVWAKADYFLEKVTPMGRPSLESYKLVARANARRGRRIEVRKSVGIEAVGMTACPCAMETIREENPAYASLKGVPIITHNQRNRTSLVVEEPEGFDIEADDLIAIVESSLSAPTYEVLKRPDEGRLVEQAHARPRFVEDVVREVLGRVLQKYKDMPDDVLVKVKSDSEESIHKHDAVAERVATLGELRAP